METVKKNLFSIIFGAVALLAVIAFFWPVWGMFDDQQEKLKEHKKTYDDLASLNTKSRSWPVIPNLVDQSNPKLQYYPTQPYIDAAVQIKADVHTQADKMKNDTAAGNEHFLLVPGVLPVAAEKGFTFRDEYLEQVRKALPKDLTRAQLVSITGGATGGTFTLKYHEQTTAPIPFDATPEMVQSELEKALRAGIEKLESDKSPEAQKTLAALKALLGPIAFSVTGRPGGPWILRPFGADLSAGAALTGGVSPGVSFSALQLPPSDAEIHAEANRLWTDVYSKQVYTVGGQPVNLPTVQSEWQKKCATLQGAMRQQRAHDLKLYLDADGLAVNVAMTDTKAGVAPVIKDIWYAQVMYWIELDIAAAIERTNDPFPNVITAPIKRVYRVTVPDASLMYVTGSSTTTGNPEPSGKAYSRTPTGRICNNGPDQKSGYDVVQFGLIMDVEADKLPAILVELQRGKLITIHKCDLSSVDAATLGDEGFIYGNVPIIHVMIMGEELLFRSWTVGEKDKDGKPIKQGFMPAEIKTELNVPQTAG